MINDQSSVINYQLINHQSSITSHQFFRHKKHTSSNNEKERAQKVIPGGTNKKGELRKVSKWHQKVKKKERKKLSPEAREKKDSSAKSLNDIKKSILRFRSNRTMDRIHGSDTLIRSMDQIHWSDPWIWSQWVPRESQKGPKETQASPKPSQETPRHFATKTSKLAEAFIKN